MDARSFRTRARARRGAARRALPSTFASTNRSARRIQGRDGPEHLLSVAMDCASELETGNGDGKKRTETANRYRLYPRSSDGKARMISIVMPAFNEEGALPVTLASVQSQLRDEHEIIIVDDGSTDGTWNVIASLSRVDPRIRGVRLSRNFGKEAAISTGLEMARGDAASVLEC